MSLFLSVSMKIVTLSPSPMYSNTYIIGDENQPCVIIDPGYNSSDYFIKYINKHHNGKCLAILLTHSHFDHFSSLIDGKLCKLGIPVYLHIDDEKGLTDGNYNCSYMCGENLSLDIYTKPMYGNELLIFDNIKLEVIHTPFHSKGSVCLYLKDDDTIFSGDTLFNRSIGRTDLRSSCPKEIKKSLQKLTIFPNNTKVLPGHGRPTTIEIEKNYGYLNSNLPF